MSRLIKDTFQLHLSNNLTSISLVTKDGLACMWLGVFRDMNWVNLVHFPRISFPGKLYKQWLSFWARIGFFKIWMLLQGWKHTQGDKELLNRVFILWKLHFMRRLIKTFRSYVFYCWAKGIISVLFLERKLLRKNNLVIILMYADSFLWIAFSPLPGGFTIVSPSFGHWSHWSDRLTGFFMTMPLNYRTKMWSWTSWMYFLICSGP